MVGMVTDCVDSNGKQKHYTIILHGIDDYRDAVDWVYWELHNRGCKVIHITVVQGEYETLCELEEIIEKDTVIPDGFICFPYQETEVKNNEEG